MEFPNHYQEKREKSQGELTQEYAALIEMATFLIGARLTDKEKAAVPIVIGAFMRERKNIDLGPLTDLLKRFA
jgi:hypothetical protein